MAEEGKDIATRPPCSYLTYKSEGDRLYRLGKYEKAIQSYTLALQCEPKNRICLMARSRCYLSMGNTTAAQSDAEVSQMENKDFLQEAAAKTKGQRRRQNLDRKQAPPKQRDQLEPKTNRTERVLLGESHHDKEQLLNLLLDKGPSCVRLDTKGELTFFYRKEEEAAPKTKGQRQRQNLDQKQAPPKQRDQLELKTNRTEQVLLGESHHDKEQLLNLLLDKETKGRSSDGVGSAPEGAAAEAGAVKGEAAATTGRGEVTGEETNKGVTAGGKACQGEEGRGTKDE